MIEGGLCIIDIINDYIVFRVIGWISYICSSTSPEVSRHSWVILRRIMNCYVFRSTLRLIHRKQGNFHKIIQNQRPGHGRLVIKNRAHGYNRNVIVCSNDSKTMRNNVSYELYVANDYTIVLMQNNE